MPIGKNLTPLQAVNAIKQLDVEKLPKNLGSSASNNIVITNDIGEISSRKLVDNYIIVSELPENDIDENMIYMIPTEYDNNTPQRSND